MLTSTRRRPGSIIAARSGSRYWNADVVAETGSSVVAGVLVGGTQQLLPVIFRRFLVVRISRALRLLSWYKHTKVLAYSSLSRMLHSARRF